jgi:hypothetical protein
MYYWPSEGGGIPGAFMMLLSFACFMSCLFFGTIRFLTKQTNEQTKNRDDFERHHLPALDRLLRVLDSPLPAHVSRAVQLHPQGTCWRGSDDEIHIIRFISDRQTDREREREREMCHYFCHSDNYLQEHHVWILPTPWAACAFHPIDGWLQSVPYLVFPYVFPVQKHQVK